MGTPGGLALLAGGLWGTSDFLGGTLSRRLRTSHVLVGSQVASVVLVLALPVVPGLGADGLGWLPWSVGAGVTWALGMGAFYTALAVGTMGVVAPIAAAGAVVPVLLGLLAGERPGAPATAGLVLGLVGVVAAAGPELGGDSGRRRQAVGLALLTALLFGLEIWCLGRGSHASVAMSLIGMRLTALACTAMACWPSRSRGRHRRAWPRPVPRDLPALAVLGGLDAAATVAYAVAARGGLVSLVAVLGSSYPAVTVVLARRLHGERLRPVQVAGVVGVLAGAAAMTLSAAS